MVNSERGNALFLILIAVALFAALSYAVTQSSRGGGSGIDAEKTRLLASRLMQYSTAIKTTVTRMTIRGTDPANLLFNLNASGADAVFAPEGGGATYTKPADLEMAGIGLGAFNIASVGTAADDITMMGVDLAQDYCAEINDGLGLGAVVSEPDNDLTVIDAYPGEMAGCLEDSGFYYYYYVLVPQ